MPDHVSEYTIVEASDRGNLTIRVNAWLNDGWKLYGDLCIVFKDRDDIVCYQAMVK